MAKKKGKREEAFTFPEFDRGEYRTKEVRDSKVAIFAVFYAVLVAVICHFIVKMTDVGGMIVFLGFAAPFGLILILPYITDTSEFERKNWFGPLFMSFMAWLGLFILLSNPPFNDIAKPKFQQVSGSKGGSGFMSYEMMTKLEDGNQFGIVADNMYYYHFEDGLSVEAYSFTFKAVDEDENSNTKRYSFVVG